MSQWGGAPAPLVREFEPPALGGQIMTSPGPIVLRTVVVQLNQRSFGTKVDSWLDEPLMADEWRQALDARTLQDVARPLEISVDQVADGLAKALPAVLDQASPEGVPDPTPVRRGAA